MLAAPLLLALGRFGGLYRFVHYSGYDKIADYVAASAAAVSWPVLALGLVGAGLGLTDRRRGATTAAAITLLVYVALTLAFAFLPLTSQLAPQLEPTRLMPLQRYLLLYLAAAAVWTMLDAMAARLPPRQSWTATALGVGLAIGVLIAKTGSTLATAPDPASPAIPPASLYAVAMSAQPQQFDLELAVRAADEAAEPGSAMLILGSALSWHQQLWAPLWTARPLYYDNWLWYWHSNHAGTPGYRFLSGNHYPDPERTLDPSYLAAHGIGAVVVTGAVRDAAARSPLLELVRSGGYDVYVVLEPVTTVTFGGDNAALLDFRNQTIHAVAATPGQPIVARINWYPRWEARVNDQPLPARRLETGYVRVDPAEPARAVEFHYGVQPLDWVARILALAGMIGVGWMARRR
jgi:hypothetical protein